MERWKEGWVVVCVAECEEGRKDRRKSARIEGWMDGLMSRAGGWCSTEKHLEGRVSSGELYEELDHSWMRSEAHEISLPGCFLTFSSHGISRDSPLRGRYHRS